MNIQLMQTSFLVPIESILILMCDNMVRTNDNSIYFCLFQPSFLVPTIQLPMDIREHFLYNCDCHDYIPRLP